MAKIPRTPERTATPEELADEDKRSQRAREQHRAIAPTDAGDLCMALRVFSVEQRCCTCGRSMLAVAGPDDVVICSTCQHIRDALGGHAHAA